MSTNHPPPDSGGDEGAAGRGDGVAAAARATTAEQLGRPTHRRGGRLLARHERTLLPLLVVAVVVAAWEAYGQLGRIDPLFFSYPSQIWHGLLELARGPLPGDLRTSAIEFALGLALAGLAVPAGLAVGASRRLQHAVNPLIDALYATPMLALTPLFVIWFGLGIASKVAVVALMAFFPLLITTIEGVATVDPTLVRAVRSFGARRWHVYRDVILPGVVPFLVSGMRLAIGRAVMGVVIGEFIAATEGVGYRIRAAATVFQTSHYLAGVVLLIVAAAVLNLGLKYLEGRVAGWRQASHPSL